MWLPPPSPSLDRVPGFTAPPAGRISQKLPVGSPNPTFLNFDPGWGGLSLWKPILNQKCLGKPTQY